MFNPKVFPQAAWFSVIDSVKLEVLVIPVQVVDHGPIPGTYKCAEIEHPVSQDFLCNTQQEAMRRISDLIGQVASDKHHVIHHMSHALAPVRAAIDAELAIQKAKVAL